LELPIVSRRWRRVVLVEMAWGRFEMAQEIDDFDA